MKLKIHFDSNELLKSHSPPKLSYDSKYSNMQYEIT